MLSDAQIAVLKADILADPALTNLPNSPDDNQRIADAENALATPDYWVWRTNVPSVEYRGASGIVWTEVDGLTVGKARIFEWLTGQLTLPINASDPNVRAGIANAFGNTSTTATNLTTMGRRRARRIEKLLAVASPNASGTRGSTANPDTLTFEGTIPYTDVEKARAPAP